MKTQNMILSLLHTGCYVGEKKIYVEKFINNLEFVSNLRKERVLIVQTLVSSGLCLNDLLSELVAILH